MAYRIAGLDPAPFMPLFAMEEDALHRRRARLAIADADRGYPCRASLSEARRGDRVLLVHHIHHDVETPYRAGFAIYIREGAERAEFVDCTPPVFEGRILSLRGFDHEGTLVSARLAMPGEADEAIRALLEADGRIAYIDAHNAAYGCFAARIERDQP
ncbi:conserved hypothetical protein [Altererythrobacter sp. B11]|uniref:DUF1203 domain-containing protein n=1 Tax=Altererythrobacter sp. B11 TaxID=2060312 RepID=UPI000DC6D9CB|nr:DUF1203 domain-containing protein [Altererythrobacter sp. B11]BBC73709.1 conserved hypothetical protein [Altererythrobacter sp. B11]